MVRHLRSVFRAILVVITTLVVSAAKLSTAVEQYVVVVLDDSGSMSEATRSVPGASKMQAAKKALIAVLNSLPADARVGVVALNQGAGPESWIVPLGPIDGASTARTISAVQPSGSTPLGYFMKVAADALLSTRKQFHYGTYRMLIVTDGEASDKSLVDRYLPEIIARGITVDVIGVDMRNDHSLARDVHSYRRADSPDELQAAVREVLAESQDRGQDSGESDFALLAGFPDEIAAAALQALARPNAAAIGAPLAESSPHPAETAAPSELPTPTDSWPPAPRNRGPTFSWSSWILLAVILMLIAKVLKKP